MGLSEIDRNLLDRCLQKKPRAWEDFVDRFMGLLLHVIRHTAQSRSIRISPADVDDLCAEVFLTIIKGDFALLRHFRGQSSLATYLTVVVRRIVVHELFARGASTRLNEGVSQSGTSQSGRAKVGAPHIADRLPDTRVSDEQRIDDREQVGRLLGGLQANEALVVRMYHLEGMTYQEIGVATGMPENSIGPILSRARDKLRQLGVNTAAT